MDETNETTGGDRRDRSTTYGIVLAVIFSIPVAILIWTILSVKHELPAGTLAGLTASIEGQIADVEAYAPPLRRETRPPLELPTGSPGGIW